MPGERVSKRKRSVLNYGEETSDLEDNEVKSKQQKTKKQGKNGNSKRKLEKISFEKVHTQPNENKETVSANKPAVQENFEGMTGRIVMTIPGLVVATVVNRPSKVVKSPYMADIIIKGKATEELCHSPALGCAGLIVPGSTVFVTPKTSTTAKSKFSLDLIDIGSSVVGANPNFCNKMVRVALEAGWVEGIPKFEKKEIKAEASIDESRFDFKCIQGITTYYIEVKGVPNACISDVKMSPMKKSKIQEEVNMARDKIAYFPDGYRKNADEAISPRALKHVEHLARLAKEPNTKCVLLFVVQRGDCTSFQPTRNDPKYRSAVHQASEEGVTVIAHTAVWEGVQATWGDVLPVNLKDELDEF